MSLAALKSATAATGQAGLNAAAAAAENARAAAALNRASTLAAKNAFLPAGGNTWLASEKAAEAVDESNRCATNAALASQQCDNNRAALNALTPTAIAEAQAALAIAGAAAQKFANSVVPCPEKTTADAALADLQAVDSKIKALQKLQAACAAAAADAAAAKADKETAVTARLAQLRSHGHGPQRHSDPDRDALKSRAVYGIDPDTGLQTEAIAGPPPGDKIHDCGACASKFKTPDDYVKAEAAMRALLKQQVCPGGVAGPPVRGSVKVSPALTTVFPVPNNHCEGFAPTHPLPKVLTTLGPVAQVPMRAQPPSIVPPPNHPLAPTFPPLVHPAPPPAHSGAQLERYHEIAEAAVQRGQNPQHAMNALKAAGGMNKHKDAIVKGFPPVVVTPPLLPADRNPAAMKAHIDTPGTTTPTDFTAGKFTAIFKPVDPARPAGEWTLHTMYPNP